MDLTEQKIDEHLLLIQARLIRDLSQLIPDQKTLDFTEWYLSNKAIFYRDICTWIKANTLVTSCSKGIHGY